MGAPVMKMTKKDEKYIELDEVRKSIRLAENIKNEKIASQLKELEKRLLNEWKEMKRDG